MPWRASRSCFLFCYVGFRLSQFLPFCGATVSIALSVDSVVTSRGGGFWLFATMHDLRLAGRLHKELKMLQDPPPGVCVWPVDDSNLSRLEAQIQGPDGTVYAKGIFKLEVEIPDRYPFEPPNVKFITPVYHPNIDSGGRICHDILNMPPKGQWRPSLNIGAVLASIRVLLEEPNHDDGLMSDISAEYKHSRALFDEKARRSTERYAMQNSAERDVSCRHIDQAEAVASHAASSKNQTFLKANQESLANPFLKEVKRMVPSKEALHEPSTSTSGETAPRVTQGRLRQNLAAKLSLAKAATTQGVRSCSLGVAGEAEQTCSLNFSSEKERPHEIEILCGVVRQNISQPGELNRSSVVDAGKETAHKPENVTAKNAPVECDKEKSDSKATDTNERIQPAVCTIRIDKQPNTQTRTSQSTQRTPIPDKGKKLMLPKTKLLKLSRSQPLASRSVEESISAGRVLLGASQVKGTTQMSEPVILLDSESDDEDFRVRARSQGVKRKNGRT